MKKIAGIGVSYLAFLLGLAALTHLYAANMSPKGLTKEFVLLNQFNHEVGETEKNPKPEIIFVGPSYTALLGRQRGARNLGYLAGTMGEISYIINRYTNPGDELIYPINLWEVTDGTLTASGDKIRPEIKYGLFRDFVLLRAKFDEMRISRDADILPRISESRHKHIARAFEDENMSLIRARTIQAQLDNLQKCDRVSAEHYQLVRKSHKNLLFFYIPIPKLSLTGDASLDEQIEHMKNLEALLLKDLEKRGVHYATRPFQPSDYNDVFHLKGKGMGLLVEAMDEDGYFSFGEEQRSDSPKPVALEKVTEGR